MRVRTAKKNGFCGIGRYETDMIYASVGTRRRGTGSGRKKCREIGTGSVKNGRVVVCVAIVGNAITTVCPCATAYGTGIGAGNFSSRTGKNIPPIFRIGIVAVFVTDGYKRIIFGDNVLPGGRLYISFQKGRTVDGYHKHQNSHKRKQYGYNGYNNNKSGLGTVVLHR